MNEGPTGSEPGTPLELGIARLRSAGKRLSQARIALIGLLVQEAQPLSIEEIHAKVRKVTLCNLVTVYRCILTFEELGLVRKEFNFEGTMLWQYVREENAVYRVVSKVSADSEALDPELSEVLGKAFEGVEKVLREKGYSEVGHRARFFAVGPGEVSGRAE
jgi:Fur family ferric uptake transcriptional regulator